MVASKKVALGALQQRDLGSVGVEGDAGVDHRVADFDDLSVQASFRIICVRGEGVCLAEARPHARRPIPEWLKIGGEGGSALITEVVLGAADGGLDGKACAEEQEGSAEGLVESGVYAASLTASIIMVSNSTGVSLPSRRCLRLRW